ncbi:MAG: patatin-like phospholipase family protein [Clostridia bacterium]|nr:patatin-like phospholipase family protein [Clostridia bacterium]
MPYIGEFALPEKPIGLALAGGGVRGYAQIGVLEMLEKHGYGVDMVAGTSIGSFVATLVAMGLSAKEIYEKFQGFENNFTQSKVFSRPDLDMLKPTKNKINGMVDGDKIIDVLNTFFEGYGVKTLCDIKKPLVIVAVEYDLCKVTYFTNVKNFTPKRDAIVLYDTPVSVAIRSSCSFPGVISVSEYEGYSFVDGGTMMNLPVEPLKELGADRVMSLTMRPDKTGFSSKSAMMVLKRATDLVQYELLNLQIMQSDFNINLDVGDFKAFDVGKGTLIYKKGANIALDMEEEIVNFFEPAPPAEPEPAPEPEPKPVSASEKIKNAFKRIFGGKKDGK